MYSNRINSLSYQREAHITVSFASFCPFRRINAPVAFAPAEAGVGQEGAVALGEALKPRDNPDGKWVLNTSVERVDLIGRAELLRPHASKGRLGGRTAALPAQEQCTAPMV